MKFRTEVTAAAWRGQQLLETGNVLFSEDVNGFPKVGLKKKNNTVIYQSCKHWYLPSSGALAVKQRKKIKISETSWSKPDCKNATLQGKGL